MMQKALTESERKRGKQLLDIIYRNSPIFNCMDIDAMSDAEAKKIWRMLEPHLPIVASRASGRKRDMKHHTVLKTMQLIQKKAGEGGLNER